MRDRFYKGEKRFFGEDINSLSDQIREEKKIAAIRANPQFDRNFEVDSPENRDVFPDYNYLNLESIINSDLPILDKIKKLIREKTDAIEMIYYDYQKKDDEKKQSSLLKHSLAFFWKDSNGDSFDTERSYFNDYINYIEIAIAELMINGANHTVSKPKKSNNDNSVLDNPQLALLVNLLYQKGVFTGTKSTFLNSVNDLAGKNEGTFNNYFYNPILTKEDGKPTTNKKVCEGVLNILKEIKDDIEIYISNHYPENRG